jgi:small conductance mechanosensitive channel
MIETLSDYFSQILPWLITSGVKILAIIIIAFILHRVLNRFVEKSVRLAVTSRNHISTHAEVQREDTLIQVFTMSIRIAIFATAVMMILPEFNIKIGAMLAAAGVVGLALGFGGQYLIRDVITGLFIILENQYRIEDVISIDGTDGVVEEITLRKTTLRDLNGTIHHIPHGEIKKVSNLTKDFSRVNLDLGISYNADLENVIKIVNQVGNQLAENPDWKEFIIKPPQFLRVNDFADSAVIIKIIGETIPLKQWAVAGELRKCLKIAFDKEGIEIPFPQMVMHQVKD